MRGQNWIQQCWPQSDLESQLVWLLIILKLAEFLTWHATLVSPLSCSVSHLQRWGSCGINLSCQQTNLSLAAFYEDSNIAEGARFYKPNTFRSHLCIHSVPILFGNFASLHLLNSGGMGCMPRCFTAGRAREISWVTHMMMRGRKNVGQEGWENQRDR